MAITDEQVEKMMEILRDTFNVKSCKKPIVQYDPSKGSYINVGESAFVFPIDHPSLLVSNTKFISTSEVIICDTTTGVFETLNTEYVPVVAEKK